MPALTERLADEQTIAVGRLLVTAHSVSAREEAERRSRGGREEAERRSRLIAAGARLTTAHSARPTHMLPPSSLQPSPQPVRSLAFSRV